MPFHYETIDYIGEGYYKAKINGLYAIVDRTGKEVLTPQFESVLEFKDDMCLVSNNIGKEGFINTRAELAIPCKYKFDYSTNNLFANGFVYTKNDSLSFLHKTMLLDKNGKEYIVRRMPFKIFQ